MIFYYSVLSISIEWLIIAFDPVGYSVRWFTAASIASVISLWDEDNH